MRRDGAVGRVDANRVLDVFEPFDLGVLKDLDAERLAGSFQTPHQTRGIDERVAIDVKEGPLVRGRVNAGLNLLFAQHLDVVAHVISQSGLFGHAFELPGCDGHTELTGALPVAFDAIAPNRGLDLVQVLARQSLDDRHLVGESGHAVLESVRE